MVGRLASIDMLRGGVMVIMALDHVRGAVHRASCAPVDLTCTTAGLFFTRWITHFVAPTFVFLAGTAAFLFRSKPGRTTGELSKFLWTRGLWLVFVEMTFVHFGWLYDFDLSGQILQVIWVIGWAMVCMAALVWMPTRFVAAFGVGIILFHNLLDSITVLGGPPSTGNAYVTAFGDGRTASVWAYLWAFLHQPTLLYYSDPSTWGPAGPLDAGPIVAFSYPLLPWLGVMAAGYGLGPVFKWEAARRRRFLLWLGAGVTLFFVVLRATNLYGDHSPWSSQERGGLYTALSFLNTTKYGPSLLFVSMTLGPALFILPLLEGVKGRVADFFVTYGRVPFFYYVVHLIFIHAVAVGISLVQGHGAAWQFGRSVYAAIPPDFGVNLPLTWFITVGVVLFLYWPSAWFARYKAGNRHKAWLSYL